MNLMKKLLKNFTAMLSTFCLFVTSVMIPAQVSVAQSRDGIADGLGLTHQLLVRTRDNAQRFSRDAQNQAQLNASQARIRQQFGVRVNLPQGSKRRVGSAANIDFNQALGNGGLIASANGLAPFNRCVFPMQVNPFPDRACKAPAPGTDPNVHALESTAFANQALQNVQDYEKLLSPAIQGGVDDLFGMSCIERSREEFLSELDANLADLKRIEETLKRFNDEQKRALVPLRDQLAIASQKLRGKNSTGVQPTKELLDIFSAQTRSTCKNVIPDSQFTQFTEQGGLETAFRSNEDNLTQTVNLARTDLPNIEASVKEAFTNLDIDGQINKLGIQGIRRQLTRQANESSASGVINREIEDFYADLEEKQTAVQRQLVGLGLGNSDSNTISLNSPNVDDNLNKGIFTDPEAYFRKRFINDCVTGNDLSSFFNGAPFQAFDETLAEGFARADKRRSRVRGSGESALNRDLQTIMNASTDGDSLVDFESRQFDQRLKNISKDSITISVNTGVDEDLTAYEYLRRRIDDCRDNFTRVPASLKGSDVNSFKRRVDNIKGSIADLKDSIQTFKSDFISEINARVVDCKGVPPITEDACTLGSPVTDPNSANFCVANARTCNDKQNACLSTLKQEFETTKVEQDQLVDQYNAVMNDFNQRYKTEINNNIKPQVAAIQNRIKSIFPDFRFNGLDPNLFVGNLLPENSNEFGVQLLGGGNLENFDAFIEQTLPALRNEISSRAQAFLQNEIDGKLANQKREEISNNIAKFKDLAQRCEGLVDNFFGQVQQTNSQITQQRNQAINDLRTECSKFSSGANDNPQGGCGSAVQSLLSAASQAGSRFDPQANGLFADFQRTCERVQSSSSDDEDDEDQEDPFAKACTSNDSSEAAVSSLVRDVIKDIPALKGKRKKIAKLITEGNFNESDLNKVIDNDELEDDENLADALAEINKKYKADKEFKEPQYTQLALSKINYYTDKLNILKELADPPEAAALPATPTNDDEVRRNNQVTNRGLLADVQELKELAQQSNNKLSHHSDIIEKFNELYDKAKPPLKDKLKQFNSKKFVPINNLLTNAAGDRPKEGFCGKVVASVHGNALSSCGNDSNTNNCLEGFKFDKKLETAFENKFESSSEAIAKATFESGIGLEEELRDIGQRIGASCIASSGQGLGESRFQPFQNGLPVEERGASRSLSGFNQ